MSAVNCIEEFLGHLERKEMAVLTWGLVDSFFSEPELEQAADQFLGSYQQRGVSVPYRSGWELVDALLDAHLLWKLPAADRYRTRMAETVRLLASLRQIFPDADNAAWRRSPHLVADYRLLLRRRLYPIREVLPASVIETLRTECGLTQLQEKVVNAFVGADAAEPKKLAQFQVRASKRILRMAGQDRTFGTVISAGTGSGKTLAFYLPAYVVMAEQISPEYWTKCLALYPRNELLKDQLREALSSAKRISAALRSHGKRPLVVGALYSDVPYSAQNILCGDMESWRRLDIAGGTAFECPFVKCPQCGQNVVWFERDLKREQERLVCLTPNCNAEIRSDEIRLTRKRMLAEPPDVLFTSTEMLNQRLSSARFSHLFGIGLRQDRRPSFVLIDEVHAYEEAHGAHVAFLLRRWKAASFARPHFVGLSATLADAPRFFAELVGIGPGDVVELHPESEELSGEGAEYLLALRGDPSSGTSLLSTTIQSLMLLRRCLAPLGNDPWFGSRVFAFTDNLDVTNRLYHNLLDAEGWDDYGRPNADRLLGSLANLRSTTLPGARERFDSGQNWALVEDLGHVLAPGSRIAVGRTSSQDAGVDANASIVVATSALEVGFDDPEVGTVLQHKAPHSPAAFLQRKGRAGRRLGMRPWTVVVLSDYGRDRSAYQSYDQLFSPYLPARHLPLRNRSILRMQATYTLFDWLAARLPASEEAEPWTDFSQPASEVKNPQFARNTARRQALYTEYLRRLLEDSQVRDEFAQFLARSLAIDDDEVTAVLWEPPRALMTEAIPTLLRRLERGWQQAGRQTLEEHVLRAPLPEFVPRTLFSDLQLPEVFIRIPAQGRNAERIECMSIAQALREFAPGRVSRRFGVSHGRERHWIEPGDEEQVQIDAFCAPTDRQALGEYTYVSEDGAVRTLPVFRPFALNVSLTPANVQQSSNSFLDWHSEFVPTAQGHRLDVPEPCVWSEIIIAFCVHAHSLGLPVEVRRFATGAKASIGKGRGPQTLYSLKFAYVSAPDTVQSAGIGFAGDMDAIQVRFRYPESLYRSCPSDERLCRGLRVARFRNLILTTPRLNGLANDFQRNWLSQVYLSTVTAEALRTGTTLELAESSVFAGSSTTTMGEVLETILQWDDNDEEADAPQDAAPKRIQELTEILNDVVTRETLHQLSDVLWQEIDENWEQWLRNRFKSTLGVAIIEAAHTLCPRMDAGALVLDLQAMENWTESANDQEPDTDAFWLTESTVGGGGFVDEFLKKYAEDPRRYFRLLDASLAASDLEVVSEDLARILQSLKADQPEDPLTRAIEGVRTTDSHVGSVSALNQLRVQLARIGIQPTPTLLVSLAARILQPGTSKKSDDFLADALDEWEQAERRLGVDIDVRVFAFVKSSQSALPDCLGIEQSSVSDNSAAWRYGVLNGMFWPRNLQLRNESLQGWNPFQRIPDCDRLMVLSTVRRSGSAIALSIPSWFDELATSLLRQGSAELVGDVGSADELASALVRLGAEPVDSDALLVHARLTGLRREGGSVFAEIELPEAFQ